MEQINMNPNPVRTEQELQTLSRILKTVGLNIDVISLDVVFGLDGVFKEHGTNTSVKMIDELTKTVLGKYPQKQ